MRTRLEGVYKKKISGDTARQREVEKRVFIKHGQVNRWARTELSDFHCVALTTGPGRLST